MNEFTPGKVFILENGTYHEISLETHLLRRDKDKEYQKKKFIGMHGMIMEVSESDYIAFYRNRRRQKYICERQRKNDDVSYDALTTDAFSGEDILVDTAEDVAGQVIRKIMVDKLNHAMLLLSEDEQLLIYRHYYAGMPETALAALYGISQQAVSKRLAKIRAKLKNLIES